ncbi:MAG: flagellar biosynthetic protein FliQ [Thermoguttaceae bacterium]|nr:flagellar biosynthetic protein FliQ [Thermoguttaceae bacterium]
METETVIQLSRESLKLALALGGPVLAVGIFVGLIVSVVQAATQIQDQTTATVLKIVAMLAAVAIFLPQSLAKIVEFSRALFENLAESTTFFLG